MSWTACARPAYANVALPPGLFDPNWWEENDWWQETTKKIYDHIFGEPGYESSGGGDIEGGGDSGGGAGASEIIDDYVFYDCVRTGWENSNYADIAGVALHRNYYLSIAETVKANPDKGLKLWIGFGKTTPYVTVNLHSAMPNIQSNYSYAWGQGYSFNAVFSRGGFWQGYTPDVVESDGKKYVVVSANPDTVATDWTVAMGSTVTDACNPLYSYYYGDVEIYTPEPESPTIHEHPDYPVNDTHPDGSGDTYTYNVYDGDDVAYTIEVEGTDLSPITLRLDDLNLMFSDFANEFSWFEDTLLSLLMRIFTMQLYIYDEIANLLDGLETLDHSTDDLADLSTVERYLEDILSAVTNFADEDTGVTLMRGYLKGIFDDFGQLLQILEDWPEYPAVEPSTVTVEPTDLDPVLTELRKIEDLLKGTGVKAPVADPGESDPEKTMGMRIGEKMDELKDRFPFSLPWDIFAILNLLRADPVAPQFDLPVFGSEESVHVDLSVWDSVAVVTRGGTTLLFALGLALRSRSLLASWGGVSGD